MLFLGNILGYVSIGPSSTRSTPYAISNGIFRLVAREMYFSTGWLWLLALAG